MADINHVTLVGRLTRDAELKFTNTGLAILKFSIAVNRWVKSGDKGGEEAHFFDVTVFGKQGEAVSQYMTKGKQVAVDGELRQDRWEKDGQKHSKVHVVANNLQLLGGSTSGGAASGGGQERPQRGYDAPEDVSGQGGGAPFEDDIPF